MSDKKEKNLHFEVEKSDFIHSFLAPASKLADILSVSIKDGVASAWATTADNTMIFFGRCAVSCEGEHTIVLPEIKNFIRLLNMIESPTISLTLTDNSFKHKTKGLSFQYHLLDESFALKKSFNQDKLDALAFDTHFYLTKDGCSSIVKMNAMVPGVAKIYFSATKEEGVVAKIADSEKQNSDSIAICVADTFVGEEMSDIPFDVTNILLLSFPQEDQLVISVNHKLRIGRILTPNKEAAAPYHYILAGLTR